MDEKMTTNRREALGFASFAVAAMTIGAPVAAASGGTPARSSVRPTAEELERAKRLYGGEFGGGNGGGR